jgi:phosphogluconate dehydratase
MSGASGKIPAAIHVSPEVLAGGPLGRVRDGDMIRVDGETGILQALVDEAVWQSRTTPHVDLSTYHMGMGRELFAMFRQCVSTAEEGGATFGLPPVQAMPQDEASLPHDTPPGSDEDFLARATKD